MAGDEPAQVGREFRGQNLEFIRDRSPEVILSGPAGTGKSVTALNKLMLIALKYPESRQLIVRKTRASLTQSGLVTWEQKILPPRLYQMVASTMKREQRSSYMFPNRSEVVVGGLDDPIKIMSTDYDEIYLQEASEASLDDWESLLSRLRNGRVPYQQLIGDTNPDAPTHWIKRREAAGLLKMLESRHENNPYLFRSDGTMTKEGRAYMAVLDRLTGVRRERLRFGRWVQAEGVVYEGWDRAVHLINRFDIPKDWPRDWVIDFGFTNPFVCQFWAEDPDGRIFLYREIYMTQRLVQDHAKLILELTKDEPRPRRVICDHDAEDRATFERHTGQVTRAAHKTVSDGIQAVATRLRRADDGKPRIFFFRDSLVERDAKLDEKKIPACTEEEIDSYIWDIKAGRLKGEQPVKANDHGMDAMRYEVAELDLRLNRPGVRRLF